MPGSHLLRSTLDVSYQGAYKPDYHPNVPLDHFDIVDTPKKEIFDIHSQ